MEKITVHPRVHQNHPEIDEEDVLTAWRNAIALYQRNYDPPEYFAAAGLDGKNRLLEMVGVATEDGGISIFHAMKLTKKMQVELEMA